jgi:type IV secretory pathway VirB2 component (pilin)
MTSRADRPPEHAATPWRRLLREHVRPHLRQLIVAAVAAMIVAALATAANAGPMEPVLDKVFLERPRGPCSDLIPGAVVVCGGAGQGLRPDLRRRAMHA